MTRKNVLKKHIASKPEVDVFHTSNKDLEVKLGGDLSEDQQCILNYLIWRHPDVFTDMPGETDVIQHSVKLKDNTPIPCKPYPLLYAKREELWNEVGSMLEMGEMRPSTSPYGRPSSWLRRKMVLTGS